MITLLFGVLGSGKSTVGQLLAKQTNARFVEMDTMIMQTMGISHPSDVSPAAWKECQIDISKDLSVQDNLVIATSGNIVENDLNILHFQNHCPDLRSVYLRTSLDTLVARTVSETQGNAHDVKKNLQEKITRREPLYTLFSQAIIDTDGKTPQQIVDAICNIRS